MRKIRAIFVIVYFIFHLQIARWIDAETIEGFLRDYVNEASKIKAAK